MATITHTPGPGRARLAAALKQLQGKQGRVGWFESSQYPDGTQVAYVAAIQEFGSPSKNIPPRMGLRGMVADRQAYWARVAEQGARQVLDGRSDANGAMKLLGAVAEADIRKQIKSVTEPPLKESTLRRRASKRGIKFEALTGTGSKPLNDTGYMMATVTHVVEDEGLGSE